MEVLSQVQSIVVEHAFTIGIGLLVATVIAAITWYWMSSRSNGLHKSSVLENQARVNSADLEGSAMDVPVSAQAPEPHSQVVHDADQVTEE